MDLQSFENSKKNNLFLSKEILLKNSDNFYKKEKIDCQIFDKLNSIKNILKDEYALEKLDCNSILAFSLFFWEVENFKDCLEISL